MRHDRSLGFIISRHIADASHSGLCFRAYTSIRKFYPDNLILIVDDGSSLLDLHSYDSRTIIVQSTVPGSGEFGLYYYYHLTHLFDRAVFLHDSMVIKRPLALSDAPIIYLWHFNHHDYLHVVKSEVGSLLKELGHKDDAERTYKSNSWIGMFGCCCVMTWDCLDRITRRYQLFRLIPKVKTRLKRCAMERVLGILFSEELDKSKPSLNGYIFQLPGAFTRSELLKDHEGYVDKTWHGR